MALMEFDKAVRVLREGGEFVRLVEAIGVLISSPRTTLEDLLLGLPHPGLVAEQAALALYRRTGRPRPGDRMSLETDPDLWAEVVRKHRESTEGAQPLARHVTGSAPS